MLVWPDNLKHMFYAARKHGLFYQKRYKKGQVNKGDGLNIFPDFR